MELFCGVDISWHDIITPIELDTGVDTLWHYIHSHVTRQRVKKHPSNYERYVCHILPWLGGGVWKYRKGGWRYRTIFSPRGENMVGGVWGCGVWGVGCGVWVGVGGGWGVGVGVGGGVGCGRGYRITPALRDVKHDGHRCHGTVWAPCHRNVLSGLWFNCTVASAWW